MSNNFFLNHAVVEIMSKNLVEPERSQMTIWRLAVCWVIKATRTEGHVHVSAPPTPPSHIHTHTHTHRGIYNTF
jgi:hypothetical protein